MKNDGTFIKIFSLAFWRQKADEYLFYKNKRIKDLEWQVANWERKEISQAICCMNNAKRVKELKIEVQKLRKALEDCGRF